MAPQQDPYAAFSLKPGRFASVKRTSGHLILPPPRPSRPASSFFAAEAVEEALETARQRSASEASLESQKERIAPAPAPDEPDWDVDMCLELAPLPAPFQVPTALEVALDPTSSRQVAQTAQNGEAAPALNMDALFLQNAELMPSDSAPDEGHQALEKMTCDQTEGTPHSTQQAAQQARAGSQSTPPSIERAASSRKPGTPAPASSRKPGTPPPASSRKPGTPAPASNRKPGTPAPASSRKPGTARPALRLQTPETALEDTNALRWEDYLLLGTAGRVEPRPTLHGTFSLADENPESPRGPDLPGGDRAIAAAALAANQSGPFEVPEQLDSTTKRPGIWLRPVVLLFFALLWIGLILMPPVGPQPAPMVQSIAELPLESYIHFDTAQIPFQEIDTMLRVQDALIVTVNRPWERLNHGQKRVRLKWLKAAAYNPNQILVFDHNAVLKAEVHEDTYTLHP